MLLKFVAELPWPEGTRPNVKIGPHADGVEIILHTPITRPTLLTAAFAGPAHEGCLQRALEQWMQKHNINNDPRFYAAIKRLAN